MSETMVLVQKEGGVCTVTLNRPEAMNSLSFPMLHELRRAVEEIQFDPEVRCVIVTGAGDRAFCAGADLKERASMMESEVRRYISTIRTTFTMVENLPVPVIAAVNGVALGGGTELALASDLRIVSEKATMGLTETSLAIIPGAGGTQRLPRLVGTSKAKEPSSPRNGSMRPVLSRLGSPTGWSPPKPSWRKHGPGQRPSRKTAR